MDASLLLLPLVGFLPATDKRMLGTIRAIEKHLMTGGLLKRNRPDRKASRQGAFLACSFWLVQVLTLVGRKRDAEKLFKKLLRLRNDVGLLSEEYDTRARELTGNFPAGSVAYCIGECGLPSGSPARTSNSWIT